MKTVRHDGLASIRRALEPERSNPTGDPDVDASGIPSLAAREHWRSTRDTKRRIGIAT